MSNSSLSDRVVNSNSHSNGNSNSNSHSNSGNSANSDTNSNSANSSGWRHAIYEDLVDVKLVAKSRRMGYHDYKHLLYAEPDRCRTMPLYSSPLLSPPFTPLSLLSALPSHPTRLTPLSPSPSHPPPSPSSHPPLPPSFSLPPSPLTHNNAFQRSLVPVSAGAKDRARVPVRNTWDMGRPS